MKSHTHQEKVNFVTECILQIWLLGTAPESCVAYTTGLKKALVYFDSEFILNDMAIIIDILEDHEKLGTLPRNKEDLQKVVAQYYGEKD